MSDYSMSKKASSLLSGPKTRKLCRAQYVREVGQQISLCRTEVNYLNIQKNKDYLVRPKQSKSSLERFYQQFCTTVSFELHLVQQNCTLQVI